ncbi:MAG: sulfotransferase domain-containing protein [Anaerolineales bacterium]|nr:sulfotransferase domain-containing protein [Anaerolineales bacterium]
MNKHLYLSVGMPRAGSGWFHTITQILVLAGGGIGAQEIRKKYHLNRFLTEVNCNIGTISSYRILPVIAPLLFERNYVIKLHGGRKPLADVLMSTGFIKATYIFRDPRDAALSIFEYGQHAINNPNSSNDFSRIRTIEGAIEYLTPYIDIARGWISSKQTFVIKYENMFSDYHSIIQRLISFLDLNLEPQKAIDLIDHLKPGDKGRRRYTHFKKGIMGRHREIFSAEQEDLCEKKFGDFLREQGYDS